MLGLELCRDYYKECVEPAIEERFSEQAARIAAGLAGQGSDCLGYDDEISRDHDFGPGCCLWLTDDDYSRFGRELAELYDELPVSFRGFKRNATLQGAGRVGVIRIGQFYTRMIGSSGVPQSDAEWLRIPEHFLAAATSGEVFYDGPGEFTRIRSGLLPCYPEEVRLKKLAARIFVMAQSGQYNYPRTLKRGDDSSAMLALEEFIRAALSAVHLLNQRYMPYYKWAFRSARGLPRLRETVASLDALHSASMGDRVSIIESICANMAAALKGDGLSGSGDSFLVAHAEEIMGRIKSEYLNRLGVMVG